MSNLARSVEILRCLGRSPEAGLRMQDIVEKTGLAKATAHRLLNELLQLDLIAFDESSSRYHLSFELFLLGSAAANRFSVVERARPALLRLAELTEDTVFLTVRNRHEAVCIDRVEGAFPLKALTSQVGGRQPLGLGAASIALLMTLPEAQVKQIIEANRLALQSQPAFDLMTFLDTLHHARQAGFVYRTSTRVAGIGVLAMPVMGPRAGGAVAAVSLSAIESRLDPGRREAIVAAMREQVTAVEAQFAI
jgi:DNA-binding IclR family transcriptional regulator